MKIINYRGFEHAQKEALNDCYKRFNKEYHWIAFFDVDEFLQIINFTNINDFMALPRFKNCESILITWKYYGDNNKLYYEPKPLYERFTKPFYFNESIKPNIFLYSAAKTIVKGGLNITWALLPHFLKNTINCRPNGNILSNYFSPPQYSTAYLIHYATKSTEEFAERCNRGNSNSKINITSRILKYYFLFNNKTKQKLEIFRKKLKYKIEF